MSMTPSSSGWRKTSGTRRRNSGRSSKRSMPVQHARTSRQCTAGMWCPSHAPRAQPRGLLLCLTRPHLASYRGRIGPVHDMIDHAVHDRLYVGVPMLGLPNEAGDGQAPGHSVGAAQTDPRGGAGPSGGGRPQGPRPVRSPGSAGDAVCRPPPGPHRRGGRVETRVDAQEVHVSGDTPLLGVLLGTPIATGLRQILQQTLQNQLP